MTRRSRGREIALQVLYLQEQNPSTDAKQVERFIAGRMREPSLIVFSRELVEGVHEHRDSIDNLIGRVAENWRLDRMAAIDRNILRLAAYEILHCPDIPTRVAINEALELAKRYSTAQSSRFVNGVLDRLQAEAAVVESEAVAAAAAEAEAAAGLDAPEAEAVADEAGTEGEGSAPTAIDEPPGAVGP
jgi:N utilization substance protein B